ncbi:MAG: hypothetical protein CL583_00205 [Alteromonadaceae bacterium]|nr:hypothetical protein [Alteromonadaceae bacterium]
MKVRKLAVALALAGTMGSSLAYALGLGEVTVNSSLNEPLSAEIDLVRPGDLTQEEIAASLAPQRDFERVGIEPMFFLNEIQFNVEKNSRGELVLKLTTRKPVREPYLNFLVEVAWPSGRLLREYALLIDPPVFRDEPADQPAQRAATPALQTRAAPAPSQRSQTSSQAQSDVSRPQSYGPVKASDTLWGIAQNMRPADDLTPQQVMLAIQDVNPDAFLSNNINLLREGSILRVPSEETIRARTAREAVQQVSSQNRRFRQQGAPSEPAIDAVSRGPATASAPEVVEQGDELRLVAGDLGTSSSDGSNAGEAGGAGEGQAQANLAITREELDQTRRENEELNSRLEDLQSQLADMRRLIELQSDQMASLQAMAEANQAAVQSDPQETDRQAPQSEQAPPAQAQSDQTQPEQTQSEQDQSEQKATQSAEPAVADQSDDAAASPAQQEPGQIDEVVAEEPAEVVEPIQPAVGEAPQPSPVADQDAASEEPAAPQAESPVASQPATTGVDSSAEEPESPLAAEGILQKLQNNPIYQVGAGAIALALLGVLWFLARKNARREEEFYAQLQSEEAGAEPKPAQDDDQADAFALGLGAGGTDAPEDDENFDERRDAETAALHAAHSEDEDPLAEADVYLAYGRLDQAVQVLENGIERDPARQDIRLKLLGIYADSGNEEAFARHMGVLENSEDENVIARGEALRERLAQQLGSSQTDDFESQLLGTGDENEFDPSVAGGEQRSDSWAGSNRADSDVETGTGSAAAFAVPEEDASANRKDTRDDLIEYDLGDLDFELDTEEDETAEHARTPADEDDLTVEDLAGGEAELADNPADVSESDPADNARSASGADNLDFTEEELRGLDFSEEPGNATGAPDDEETLAFDDEQLADLDLSDLEGDSALESDADSSVYTAAVDSPESGADASEAAAKSAGEAAPGKPDDVSTFDESFLDELDAELEKVTRDEGEDFGTDGLGDGLDERLDRDADIDDLELDVSDEDLAFIEEVSGGSDSASGIEPPIANAADEQTDEEESLDFDLEDAASLGETADSEPEPEIANDRVDEVPEATGSAQEGDLEGFDDSLLDVNESDLTDLSEDDIGDDDDFGFLDGADEAATKLDLARAYFEMGDAEGARDILEEVISEGSDSQKAEAQELLGKLS